MTGRWVYLHGFASSPRSQKAGEFKARLAEIGVRLEVPDLAERDFPNLTITRQLRLLDRLVGDDSVGLMGSSLGGYLAALYAARRPQVHRIVCMAPAFRFHARWLELLGEKAVTNWRKTGYRSFFHYGSGRNEPLAYAFLEDAGRYEAFPDVRQPVLIFHGEHDQTVPVEASREFAAGRENVDLVVLDTDHEMLDVTAEMWPRMRRFVERF